MMCQRTIIPEHVRDFSVKRLCKLLLQLIKALATETLMNYKANKVNIERLRVTYVTSRDTAEHCRAVMNHRQKKQRCGRILKDEAV